MKNIGFKNGFFLLAGVSTVSLLASTIGGIWQADFATQAAARIYTERTAPTISIMKSVDSLHRAREIVLIALSAENDSSVKTQLEKIKQLDKDVAESLRIAADAAPDQRAAIAELDLLLSEYNKARNQSIMMIEVGDLSSAMGNIKTNAGPKFEHVLVSLEKVIAQQGALAKTDHEATSANLSSRTTGLIVFAALTTLAMLALFAAIASRLFRQIGGEPARAREAMSQVAGGNLAYRIPDAEDGSLLAGLGAMSQSLSDTVTGIKDLADFIEDRSQKTFGLLQNIAARSQEQADSATDAASNVDALASSIDSVSENALATGVAAEQSLSRARAGHASINQLVGSMDELSVTADRSSQTIRYLVDSSSSIVGIVSSIKDIADQTNLLALNAAIEAARAGETGRGFAVVADEVRKLAEKTTTATQEIQRVLQQIQQSAGEASEQMLESHAKIKDGTIQAANVSSSISGIEEQLSSIAAAARKTSDALVEQRTAGLSIASLVDQIAVVATANSATTQDVVIEASHVADAADGLKSKMDVFKL